MIADTSLSLRSSQAEQLRHGHALELKTARSEHAAALSKVRSDECAANDLRQQLQRAAADHATAEVSRAFPECTRGPF
jgi:hypothetical protein